MRRDLKRGRKDETLLQWGLMAHDLVQLWRRWPAERSGLWKELTDYGDGNGGRR